MGTAPLMKLGLLVCFFFLFVCVNFHGIVQISLTINACWLDLKHIYLIFFIKAFLLSAFFKEKKTA